VRSCLKAISWHTTIGASSLSARPDEPGYLQVVRQVVALPGCPVADSCPVAGRTGRCLLRDVRYRYQWRTQDSDRTRLLLFSPVPFPPVSRERKCADTIGTVPVPLGWPFPVLKYEYIFQIKYTEAILSNSTGKLLWFEITKMLIAVQEKINKFTVNYYNFRHTFVPSSLPFLPLAFCPTIINPAEGHITLSFTG